MKTGWQISVAVGALLLSAVSSQAQIQAVFENPLSEQAISGINLISGWAFPTDDSKDLTIYVRIDGVTNKNVKIPCCSERPDVNAAIPGAPADSGFGLLFNYARLSAGPHTIGVDIRSSDALDELLGDQERRVFDHSVVIARPGNTEFVDALNLISATCSIVPGGQEVVISGAQLHSSSAGSVTSDLHATYETSLQGFVVNSATGGPAITQFVAHLNGSQEAPQRVQTSATGEATISLNADNSLNCIISTTDLSDAIAAHIHLAPAGEAGDIIIPLNSGAGATWTCPSTVLTTAQLNALQTAQLYMNIHTPDHPAGEVRGQIVAAPL